MDLIRHRRAKRGPVHAFQRKLALEPLSSRLVLSGSQFPGNDCPPDLDLSSIPAQSVAVGDTLTLDLLTAGAGIVDNDAIGQPTNDSIRLLLDPDVGTDTPEGISISAAGLLTWTPDQSQIGTHAIVVIAVDAGVPVLADAETLEIVVGDVVPDPPVVDLNGSDEGGIDFDATFTEDGGAVPIVDVDLHVENPSGSTLSTARVRLTNSLDGDRETLTVDTMGTSIDATYDPDTGTLSLTNTDTVGNYQQVLRSLSYMNSSDAPDTSATRLVEVTVTGNDVDSATATANVTVVAVNDAPDLQAIPNQSIELNQLLSVPVTVLDPDGGDTITFFLDGDDAPATATVEKTSDRTAEVRWTPTGDDQIGTFTIRVLATDDGAPALVDQEAFSVVVTPPPISLSVDLNGDAAGIDSVATFRENDGMSVIASANLSIANADNEIETMTATLTTRPDGDQERIEVNETVASNVGIVSVASDGSSSLTLTGPATIEEFESVLKTLSYGNTSDTPNTSLRRVEIVASSMADTSTPAFIDVSVIPENDAPSLTAIGDQDAVVGELLSIEVTATDPDNDSLSFQLTSGPASAEIQPSVENSATFQWTPTEDDASTTTTFEVTVFDNGDPALTGTTSFDVTVAAAAELDHTIAGASPLTLDSGETKTVAGRIDPFDDVDLYAINIEPGQVLAADASPSPIFAPYKIRFFDSSGSEIESLDSVDDTPMIVAVVTERVYVGVSSPNNLDYNAVDGTGPPGAGNPITGDYSVDFSVDVLTPPPDNTIDGAVHVPLATGNIVTVSGNIDLGSDVDLYAFKVTNGQVLAAGASISPVGAPFLVRFFDSSGVIMEESSADDGTPLIVAPSDGRVYVGLSAINNQLYNPVDGSNATPIGDPIIGDYTVDFSLDVLSPSMSAAPASNSVEPLPQGTIDPAATDEIFASLADF